MTKNIALEPRPSEQMSESYSDELMDDLFGDVDQILAGDPSVCMAIVKSPTEPHSPKNKTVQLPANFTARSAADVYRATMVASTQASNAQVNSMQMSNRLADQQENQSLLPQQTSQGYRKGGRPMTAFQGNPAQSGNFQSAVIQSSTDLSADAATDTGAATIDVQPNAQLEDSFSYPPDSATELAPSLTSTTSTLTSPAASKSKASKLPVSLPFLLIGAAGISMIGTLCIWVLGHSNPGRAQLLSFNTEASAAELPQRSDEAFLVYLQRSLDTISTKQANQNSPNQTAATLPGASPSSSVPATVSPSAAAAPAASTSAASTPTASAPTASAPSIIERVFVPVYQNEQTNNPVAAAPTAPGPTDANRSTVPVPAPVAAAAALPAGSSAPAATLPTLPASSTALPTPPTTTATAPTNSAAAAVVDTTPVAEQVLVGVLNLGSRSAALFDVDGTSQRTYVGDRIGTSDWSLVSVNGQDVVIRRNGEVRSVYIGQRF